MGLMTPGGAMDVAGRIRRGDTVGHIEMVAIGTLLEVVGGQQPKAGRLTLCEEAIARIEARLDSHSETLAAHNKMIHANDHAWGEIAEAVLAVNARLEAVEAPEDAAHTFRGADDRAVPDVMHDATLRGAGIDPDRHKEAEPETYLTMREMADNLGGAAYQDIYRLFCRIAPSRKESVVAAAPPRELTNEELAVGLSAYENHPYRRMGGATAFRDAVAKVREGK